MERTLSYDAQIPSKLRTGSPVSPLDGGAKMMLILPLRTGDCLDLGDGKPWVPIDLDGQTFCAVVTENLLDNHFRPDCMFQVKILRKTHGRVDGTAGPATVGMFLALPAADAERSACVTLLVSPYVLAEDGEHTSVPRTM